jgi:hypothetical protein
VSVIFENGMVTGWTFNKSPQIPIGLEVHEMLSYHTLFIMPLSWWGKVEPVGINYGAARPA